MNNKKLKHERLPWEPAPRYTEPQQGRKEKTGFYNTQAWAKVRFAFRKAHPLCAECLKNGIETPMYIVDHIKPIRQGGAPLAWDNLQSLCNSCHNKKSAKEKTK